MNELRNYPFDEVEPSTPLALEDQLFATNLKIFEQSDECAKERINRQAGWSSLDAAALALTEHSNRNMSLTVNSKNT
ncbi:unnamed protein product [Gongylonema pulchrum]|uniref:Acyl-CoA dehydrogenase n=1 Tax=Gongylonema pulchrum TaxID=637853 RepID=A0A183ECR0_9BILA|nr:unnamed protein product [Gongylonema pulchrum]